ncbi:hypothetical protein SCUCBS95973_009731 [Sporothrix curviconia]|uniref:Short chain dehydrogenase/reductase n=1 Tax=Sporothrix curviconia TaxID=1260050 RepID=A0ABP0CXB2_9PEZI
MTSVDIPADHPLFTEAKDKVVVLTGGATGIGAATVRKLHGLGAFVNFLDVDRKNAEALVQGLGGSNPVRFYPGSVSVWADQVRFFEGVVAQYGRVDIVLANAGIMSAGEPLLADTLDDAGHLKEPSLGVLDVTLRGVILTSKLAIHTFRKQKSPGSLVITGSAASYVDAPGLPLYGVAKHGVLGLMRSLRDDIAAEPTNIRVNLVAPSFVDTPFTAHALATWKKNNLPINQASDIAKALLFLALNQEYNGRSIYVTGGIFAEIEGPIEATRPTWLGKQNEEWYQQRKATARLADKA